MFGNQYRYGIEIANEETQVYITEMIVNEVFEIARMKQVPDEFRIVIYRQNADGIYVRGSQVTLVELTDKEGHARNAALIEALNSVADIA